MQPLLDGAEPHEDGARRHRRIATFLYLGTVLWGVSIGLWSVSLPFRFEQLGLPVVEYGVTLSVYAAGMLLTESVWGLLAFRLGRAGRIGAIGLVVGAATLGLGLSTTFGAFLAALAVLGAVGVYLAPLQRWVSLSYRGPGSEGSGTGRWSSTFGLGLAVGAALGALSFVKVGFLAVSEVSLLFLAGAVVAAMALPWRDAALPRPRLEVRSTVRRLATRPFLVALCLVGLTFMAYTFATNFLQYYSTVLFGGTASEAGYVLGAGRIVALVAAFLLGTVVDRWGAARSIPLGFVLLLAGGIGTWVSASYSEMVAATLVFFAGYGWLSASLLPLALRSMPVADQGTAIGIFGSLEDAGLLLGPLLFGATWEVYGPRSIFPVVTALAAVGVGASLLVALGRDTGTPGALAAEIPVQPPG